jgi:SAM-dependent methyltransferase
MPPVQEVPSPVDFADMAQARAWVANAVARRPWRPRFFEAFAAALDGYFDTPARVAEIGSGPGHLAGAVLRRCRVARYTALDLSPAMHEIAREHLGDMAARVRFVIADFRQPDWARDLGDVDALLTMQAAHEVRHRSRLPLLFARVRDAIRPGGLFLYSDHYFEAGGGRNPELYVTREEQPRLLAQAGFDAVRLVHDEGGMALYAAGRP